MTSCYVTLHFFPFYLFTVLYFRIGLLLNCFCFLFYLRFFSFHLLSLLRYRLFHVVNLCSLSVEFDDCCFTDAFLDHLACRVRLSGKNLSQARFRSISSCISWSSSSSGSRQRVRWISRRYLNMYQISSHQA